MKRILYFVAAVLTLISPAVFAQPAASAWPMFQHDAQHTGRATVNGPATCALEWSYEIPQGVNYSSPAIGLDGRIFVGSNNNNLYCFTSTGSFAWSYYVLATGTTSTASIDVNGNVYFGGPYLYVLGSGGQLSWSYNAGWSVPSTTLGADGSIYFGSQSDCIFALASAGSQRWSYFTDGPIVSAAALDAAGRVTVNSRVDDTTTGTVYTLNASSGALVWTYDTGAGSNYFNFSPAVGADGRIYTASTGDYLLALRSNGTMDWSYITGSYFYTCCCPAVDAADQKICFGTNDNRLYAVRSTGSLLWSYNVGTAISGSPVIDQGGRVFCPTFNSVVACDGSGTLLWSYRNGSVIQSSPAISADGKLYVAEFYNSSIPKRLYCFGAGGPVPTPTVTPTSQYTATPTRTPTQMSPTSTPSPTVPAPVPTAQNDLNGTEFSPGDYFSATFKLNEPIERPFTVFSVIIMPGGSMLDTMTLGPNIKPLASNVPRLDAPFQYPLLSLNLPAGAPIGAYEILVAFFDPSKPITGRADAFLDVSAKFGIR